MMEKDCFFPPRFVVNYKSDNPGVQLNSRIIVSTKNDECSPAEENEMIYLVVLNSSTTEGK